MKSLKTFIICGLLISCFAGETNEIEKSEILKTKRYVLTIEFRESSFSLSISKHIKNALNAATFQIPVDKEFYESVKVGQEIVDKFKTGSLFLRGNFGSYVMTVKEKQAISQ